MTRRSECRAQDLHDPFRFFGDLPFAEAGDLEASRPQLQITGSVILEGLTPSVVAVTVGFDDQAPITPEEIDQVRASANVYLRHGQSMASTEPQKEQLQVAARSVWDNFGTDWQAKHVNLADRPPQLLV